MSYKLVYKILTISVFKQKTAYQLRISDWSSDVCSSDLEAEICSRCSDPALGRSGLMQVKAAAGGQRHPAAMTAAERSILIIQGHQIGRASCRERVCQYV